VTEEAKRYILGHTETRPTIGLVLGSGLGAFADELTERTDIPYADIPGWPHSTAVGHAGKLIVGKLGELNVAVMAGRAHAYEGYAMHQVTYGVRVLIPSLRQRDPASARASTLVSWCGMRGVVSLAAALALPAALPSGEAFPQRDLHIRTSASKTELL